MAHYSLTFENVDNADQVNRITTALMMLEGVDSVEVGRYGADIEGTVGRDVLISAVRKLGIEVS
ncbi:hypothetical protein [Aidingimonas halophila]|uniref:Uncharacterized protein n=1 Tax=Aidingimonas halophila TaxID=574349 RepID=A0A1H3BTB3_9GAMM|nr:hypothetical protein [Aidingimonas halophila]GHC27067.1 hypothetical protein GCM10008094_18190 [Aidingimonas halophila]SDX44898.1 hypothetical protein SAMN05443545_105311 [Aidingimonas halophila]